MAARVHPAEDHVIAGRHRRDAGPHVGDDARALVPDDARRRHRQDAALDAEVAVTDAAGRQLDAHLSLTRRCELHVLDRERLVEAVQDGGAHGGPPRGLRFGGGYTTVRVRAVAGGLPNVSIRLSRLRLWPLRRGDGYSPGTPIYRPVCNHPRNLPTCRGPSSS